MVETLVRFMGSYYSPAEIVDIGVGMAEDIALDDPRLTELQSTAFRHLVALPELGSLVVDLLTQDSVIGAFGSAQTPDFIEPIVNALIVKAETLETGQRLEEALDCWEEVIRIAEDIGDDDLIIAKGVATLNKIALLKKLGRFDEAIKATAVSYFAPDQSVDVDTADAIARLHLGIDDVSTHPVGFAYRALILLVHGEVEAAICETDAALELLENGIGDSDRQMRSVAIVMKGLLAATLGRAIEKTDAEKVLSDIGKQGLVVLPTHTVHVLLQYFVTIEPTEALAMIESTGAVAPLQPIVVAFQRELGQTPMVARELDEVSNDVQKTISRFRKDLEAHLN